jgi:8-oxo-dGTP diphosphatase
MFLENLYAFVNLPVIRVICAVVVYQGTVFGARRGPYGSQSLKWEFPGGKVEAGETDEACLHRELSEELNMQVDIIEKLPPFSHQYTKIQIELVPFICRAYTNDYTLHEHVEAGWYSSRELMELDWADADVRLMQTVVDLFYTKGSSLSVP